MMHENPWEFSGRSRSRLASDIVSADEIRELFPGLLLLEQADLAASMRK
jgi:hypothetical protein